MRGIPSEQFSLPVLRFGKLLSEHADLEGHFYRLKQFLFQFFMFNLEARDNGIHMRDDTRNHQDLAASWAEARLLL